jgi:hypothetical protein
MSLFSTLFPLTHIQLYLSYPHSDRKFPDTAHNFGLIFSPVPSSLNEPFSCMRLKNSLAWTGGMSGPVSDVAPETASW